MEQRARYPVFPLPTIIREFPNAVVSLPPFLSRHFPAGFIPVYSGQSTPATLSGDLSFAASPLRKEIPVCSMKPEYPVGGKVSAYPKASKYGTRRRDRFCRTCSKELSPSSSSSPPAPRTYATPHNNPLFSALVSSSTSSSHPAPLPPFSPSRAPCVSTRILAVSLPCRPNIALPLPFLRSFRSIIRSPRILHYAGIFRTGGHPTLAYARGAARRGGCMRHVGGVGACARGENTGSSVPCFGIQLWEDFHYAPARRVRVCVYVYALSRMQNAFRF